MCRVLQEYYCSLVANYVSAQLSFCKKYEINLKLTIKSVIFFIVYVCFLPQNKKVLLTEIMRSKMLIRFLTQIWPHCDNVNIESANVCYFFTLRLCANCWSQNKYCWCSFMKCVYEKLSKNHSCLGKESLHFWHVWLSCNVAKSVLLL